MAHSKVPLVLPLVETDKMPNPQTLTPLEAAVIVAGLAELLVLPPLGADSA